MIGIVNECDPTLNGMYYNTHTHTHRDPSHFKQKKTHVPYRAREPGTPSVPILYVLTKKHDLHTHTHKRIV